MVLPCRLGKVHVDLPRWSTPSRQARHVTFVSVSQTTNVSRREVIMPSESRPWYLSSLTDKSSNDVDLPLPFRPPVQRARKGDSGCCRPGKCWQVYMCVLCTRTTLEAAAKQRQWAMAQYCRLLRKDSFDCKFSKPAWSVGVDAKSDCMHEAASSCLTIPLSISFYAVFVVSGWTGMFAWVFLRSSRALFQATTEFWEGLISATHRYSMSVLVAHK